MFRYSFIADQLLKALTHKYIRRVPKGVTKTGATRYMYYYAGQEGHGKGVAHESELIQGASFAFGEHGKSRYHAHITKVDGDNLTIKYDDGDKKGKEETMTKKEFQALIHGEHSQAIKQAQSKAEKQLQEAKTGKERGVKFSDKTMSKLEERVKTLQGLTQKQEEKKKNPKRTGRFDHLSQDELHKMMEYSMTNTFDQYDRIEELCYKIRDAQNIIETEDIPVSIDSIVTPKFIDNLKTSQIADYLRSYSISMGMVNDTPQLKNTNAFKMIKEYGSRDEIYYKEISDRVASSQEAKNLILQAVKDAQSAKGHEDIDAIEAHITKATKELVKKEIQEIIDNPEQLTKAETEYTAKNDLANFAKIASFSQKANRITHSDELKTEIGDLLYNKVYMTDTHFFMYGNHDTSNVTTFKLPSNIKMSNDVGIIAINRKDMDTLAKVKGDINVEKDGSSIIFKDAKGKKIIEIGNMSDKVQNALNKIPNIMTTIQDAINSSVKFEIPNQMKKELLSLSSKAHQFALVKIEDNHLNISVRPDFARGSSRINNMKHDVFVDKIVSIPLDKEGTKDLRRTSLVSLETIQNMVANGSNSIGVTKQGSTGFVSFTNNDGLSTLM